MSSERSWSSTDEPPKLLPLPSMLVSSDAAQRASCDALISTPFIDLKPQDFMVQEKAESEQSRKRTRTLMTPFQTRVLKKVLQKTAFPSVALRSNLSKLLGVPGRTIQIWFQNQRQKARQQVQQRAQPLDVLASVASKTQTVAARQVTLPAILDAKVNGEPLRKQSDKSQGGHLRPWLL